MADISFAAWVGGVSTLIIAAVVNNNLMYRSKNRERNQETYYMLSSIEAEIQSVLIQIESAEQSYPPGLYSSNIITLYKDPIVYMSLVPNLGRFGSAAPPVVKFYESQWTLSKAEEKLVVIGQEIIHAFRVDTIKSGHLALSAIDVEKNRIKAIL